MRETLIISGLFAAAVLAVSLPPVAWGQRQDVSLSETMVEIPAEDMIPDPVIGEPILDPNHERIGSIKDFVSESGDLSGIVAEISASPNQEPRTVLLGPGDVKFYEEPGDEVSVYVATPRSELLSLPEYPPPAE